VPRGIRESSSGQLVSSVCTVKSPTADGSRKERSAVKVIVEIPDISVEKHLEMQQALAGKILHLDWKPEEGEMTQIQVLSVVELTGPMLVLDDIMDLAVEREISNFFTGYTMEMLPNGEEFTIGGEKYGFVEDVPGDVMVGDGAMVIQRKSDNQYFEVMPDYEVYHLYSRKTEESAT
jgi:hypothetical protein